MKPLSEQLANLSVRVKNAAGAAADLTIVPPPAAAPTSRPEQVSRARDHSEHE